MENTITLITAFAALLTAIAALWNIKELRNQRTLSQKPDLIIHNKKFEIFCRDKFNDIPLLINDENLMDFDPKDRSNSLAVDVYNIGLGCAKKIKINFSYDPCSYIDFISRFDKDQIFKIENYKKAISIFADNPKLEIHIPHNTYFDLSYILPVSITKDLKRVDIPFSYLYLYLVFLHTYYNLYSYYTSKSYKKYENPPALNLNVIYYDQDGIKYIKAFEIHIEVTYLLAAKFLIDVLDKKKPSGLGEIKVFEKTTS